jgi:hypothetical protein
MIWPLSQQQDFTLCAWSGALAAVATIWLSAPAGAQPVAQPGMVADPSSATAMVQVISGCQGTAQLTIPLTAAPKTYRVSATIVSSGWLSPDRGDGLTQGSALALAQNFNICDELLFRDLVNQVAQEQGWDPTDVVRNAQRINEIGQHSQLLDRQPMQLVILPHGQPDSTKSECLTTGQPDSTKSKCPTTGTTTTRLQTFD